MRLVDGDALLEKWKNLARNFGFLACHENYTIFRTNQVKTRFLWS